MLRKIFLVMKAIAIAVGLALLAGIVIAVSYFLGVILSVAGVVAVIAFIVVAIHQESKRTKQ